MQLGIKFLLSLSDSFTSEKLNSSHPTGNGVPCYFASIINTSIYFKSKKAEMHFYSRKLFRVKLLRIFRISNVVFAVAKLLHYKSAGRININLRKMKK